MTFWPAMFAGLCVATGLAVICAGFYYTRDRKDDE